MVECELSVVESKNPLPFVLRRIFGIRFQFPGPLQSVCVVCANDGRIAINFVA